MIIVFIIIMFIIISLQFIIIIIIIIIIFIINHCTVLIHPFYSFSFEISGAYKKETKNSTLDKLLFGGIYPIKIPEKAIQILLVV